MGRVSEAETRAASASISGRIGAGHGRLCEGRIDVVFSVVNLDVFKAKFY